MGILTEEAAQNAAVEDEKIINGVHNYSTEEAYVKPEDPKVLERLNWFQDQKLGLMMHWGPYAQLGIVASWALSDQDADWSRTGIDWEVTGEEFKKQYFALNRTFNPLRFDPEEWERFVTFTHNQIRELAGNYGRLEGMWFDAGWVCARNGQDIRLGEVIEEIRRFQPGMLCADRTVGGPYENYVTPEQCVPDEPLLIPWESSITLGEDYSFQYEDTYKTAREVIGLLIDVVVKGGNLAINVGPQPDGRIPAGNVRVLKKLGAWLSEYGDAIYGTRAVRTRFLPEITADGRAC